jgi:cytochrome c peroxidase
MHDGSRKTLADVIDLYDQGGIARPSRDLLIRPLHLSPEEKTDLLAFLQTLSGPVSADDTPPFPIQTKNLPRQ